MRYFKLILTIIIVGFFIDGYAQEPKKKNQIRYYSSTLQIDSSNADSVSRIQDNYKAGISLIMSDTTLNGVRRERKIQALMKSRNENLKRHLSEIQLQKIVSPTERISDAIGKN